MKISEVEKKQAFQATDSVPIGAANSDAALRVTGDQIKAYCNASEGTATASTIGTVRVKLSDGKYGEISKADFYNAVKAAINPLCAVQSGASSADLNTLRANGMYVVTASAANNVSAETAFLTVVCPITADRCYQTLCTYSGISYSRAWNGTAWSAWVRVDNFGYSTLNNLASGIRSSITSTDVTASTPVNLNDYTTSGTFHFHMPSSAIPSNNPITQNFDSILEVTKYNNQFIIQQITFNRGDSYIRARRDGVWDAWKTSTLNARSLPSVTALTDTSITIGTFNFNAATSGYTDLPSGCDAWAIFENVGNPTGDRIQRIHKLSNGYVWERTLSGTSVLSNWKRLDNV